MNIMKPGIFWLCLAVVLFYSISASGQNERHVPGEILVRGKEEVVLAVVRDFQLFDGVPTRLIPLRRVSAPLNIWLLRFDASSVPEERLLEALRNHGSLQEAQFNHRLAPRQIPDDPEFSKQWQFLNTGSPSGTYDADTDATQAWDHAVGGLSPMGDTIVIAVLDDGIDPGHADFGGNLWINHQEIPNNGIDDDGNGYVDDYRGWNVKTNNDQISAGGGAGWHGTQVCGMIGARGDNGIGISGINWKVKLMIVKSDFNTDEASVLEAYSYPLAMRKEYNQTNGAKGAFVVATNASWGLEFAMPADAPLWCALFDSLGMQGILNCAATSNLNYNVDALGDLPSTCPSDYLLSVTATDADDKRNFSAFGPVSVDLAAPGEEVFTTHKGNQYGLSSGTSLSAPLVAGAIGLLYAANCPDLTQLAKSNPSGAALMARQLILNGLDSLPGLSGEVAGSGRLNVYHSIQQLLNNCGTCATPDYLHTQNAGDEKVTLNWYSPGASGFTLHFRKAGAPVWNAKENVSAPFTLNGLDACTSYEFRVSAHCPDGNTPFSPIAGFSTDGCCEAPASVTVEEVGASVAKLSWPGVLAADHYLLRYRNAGGNLGWQEKVVNKTDAWLTGLEHCSDYSAQLFTICNSGPQLPPATPEFGFSTMGCSGCVDGNYCEIDPSGIFSDLEWIESVQLKNLNNVSGNDGGYAFFTSPVVSLKTDSSYQITIEPGFGPFVFFENFYVYLDFNQDGDFEDAGELAFEGGPSTEAVTGTISVPSDAVWGLTRMRVILSFGVNNTPCPMFLSGEVEDYCVEIAPSFLPCIIPQGLDTLSVEEDAVVLEWEPGNSTTIGYQLRYRKLGETDWQEVVASTSPKELSGLDLCEDYEVQVRSICSNDLSDFSSTFTFTSDCAVSAQAVYLPDSPGLEMRAFPNPFRDALSIRFSSGSSRRLELRLLDLNGRILLQEQLLLSPGSQVFHFDDFSRLSEGTYFLQCLSEENLIVKKLVKTK